MLSWDFQMPGSRPVSLVKPKTAYMALEPLALPWPGTQNTRCKGSQLPPSRATHRWDMLTFGLDLRDKKHAPKCPGNGSQPWAPLWAAPHSRGSSKSKFGKAQMALLHIWTRTSLSGLRPGFTQCLTWQPHATESNDPPAQLHNRRMGWGVKNQCVDCRWGHPINEQGKDSIPTSRQLLTNHVFTAKQSHIG